MMHRGEPRAVETNWPASCYVPRHRAPVVQHDALARRLDEEAPVDLTLTGRGLLLLFPRGVCGHIICKPLDSCCLA